MAKKKEIVHLKILQINDTHSYLELHNEHVYTPEGIEVEQAGGYARLKHIVEACRKERGNVILLDNGDTLHGTYDAVASKGWNMVDILEHMGFDAMTFHWDSAYTPQNLKKLEKELSYPILAINCYSKKTGKLYFTPYIMKEFEGLKVGIIGIAANFIDKMMPPKFSEGVRFTMGDEELPGYIKEVRAKGADLVILLSHNGFPQDIQMLKTIPGIDICLSGHTHNRLYDIVKINDSYIIQSGSHGSFIGHIDLAYDGKIKDICHELIYVDESVPEDKEMKKLVDLALENNREMLKEKVGKTKSLLHRATSLSSPMDNLLLKSLLLASDAEIAFSNGWRYGAPIPPGKITLEDLYRIIPVNPPVSTAILTGEEIWDMVEQNLQNTYATDPYKQMGGYVKRAMGIRVYFKVENPETLRVQQIYVGDKPLDREKDYKVAYVTRQGVPADKYGREHKNLEVDAIEAIRTYLSKHDFVDDTKEAFVVV